MRRWLQVTLYTVLAVGFLVLMAVFIWDAVHDWVE